jgi:hypothetical protein
LNARKSDSVFLVKRLESGTDPIATGSYAEPTKFPNGVKFVVADA